MLVVDDNRVVLELTQHVVSRLGYPCRTAISAYEALDILAEDPAIGIVMADIDMPDLDGLDLAQDLKERFGESRPLVTIIYSEYLDYESTLIAIRSGVFDVLEKPASTRDIAAVLRRAQLAWRRQANSVTTDGTTHLATDMANPVPARTAKQTPIMSVSPDEQSPNDPATAIRELIARRRERSEVIPGPLLNDPAWDMVLDMALSKLEGKTLSVSSVCMATGAPFTTAIRWLKQMQADNLVRRWNDPQDRRRDLIELTDECFERVQNYVYKHFLK